jgi:alkylated DNA repair dioxygenase AlkB
MAAVRRPREDPEDPIETDEAPAAKHHTTFRNTESWFFPLADTHNKFGLGLKDFKCPGLIDDAVASVEKLLTAKPPIMIYGKPSAQPRDVGFFSNDVPSFPYSKGNKMPAKPLPLALVALLEAVNHLCAREEFNAVLVNRYNDGNDYISAHSDDDRHYDSKNGVCCLSVGASRTLRIRDKKSKAKVCDLRISDGCLYDMVGADFQRLYTHEILKEADCVDTRISFTFRKH